MASRRYKGASDEEEEHNVLLASLSSDAKKPPSTKNNMVVCVVFFSLLSSHARTLTTHVVQRTNKRALVTGIVLPLLVLVGIPLVILQHVPAHHFWTHINIVWTALLHLGTLPLVLVSASIAIHHVLQNKTNRWSLKSKACVLIGVLAAIIIVNCQIQVIYPSWIWNPFLLGRYPIYLPSDLQGALQGICVDQDSTNPHPLCLKERSWNILSAGVLSSKNKQDVEAVTRGVEYAQTLSGGLVVNVMARDTVDAIPSLEKNVEALLPFFKNVAVVVFENDSTDGTREAFQEWSSRIPEKSGYKVDIMKCGPTNPDCKFGISHRYDAKEATDYFTSSAIGKMADYRQHMSDYILENYSTYSHMVVIDLDLKVSLSPFGILHTLGTRPKDAVASSGRQVWPGSLGTLTPPYDFSAFRPLQTEENKHLLAVHEGFCGLLPKGDRWRNQCDAASSIHLLFVLQHDWLLQDQPYQVASAFNGATLYPLALVRESGAKYDSGDDGQRCEHIGFNLKMPFYVNPRWNFHVLPTNPGGPTGVRSLKNVIRIVFMPRLSMIIFFQLKIFLVTFVACCMMIFRQVAGLVYTAIRASGGTDLFKGGLKDTTGEASSLGELPMTFADLERDGEGSMAFSNSSTAGTAAKRTSPKTSPKRGA